LTREEVAALIDYLPPRVTSRFRVGGGDGIEAVYIETFIRPDELQGRPGRQVMRKVSQAISVAGREGAQIAALGGFTSILVEAGAPLPDNAPSLTSGNSLTAGLIVQGAQRALARFGRALEDERVLVIGATGDVGSGVSRWLAGRCGRLTLAARNAVRLERERERLAARAEVTITSDVATALPDATLVIAAASTTDNPFALDGCHPGTVLADAGYPKNLARSRPPGVHLFHAGMGLIAGGLVSHDGVLERFYRFPAPGVAHGCMLEGAVLALSGEFAGGSLGRGGITPERIDELLTLAERHGVEPTLFDENGQWPTSFAHVG
jgi:fatty aldehyde-generating acyl-ACP reductase